MPYPAALVGRRTDPITHEVDARWTMAYAAGIGAQGDCYFDTRVSVVAHPVFPVCLEWPAVLALRAVDTGGALGRDELLRGVHATHEMTLHRPIRPPETLTTTAKVLAIEARRPGTYEIVRLDTVDRDGAPVVTTHMGSLFLGVGLDGEPVPVDRVVPAAPTPGVFGDRAEDRIDVSALAAHVYTECARIFNPIHTDVTVAEAAGLPGPILHGTATLAMAVSAVVDRAGGGEPSAVQRLGCRFGAMVPMPDRIGVRIGEPATTEDGRVVGFEVRNGAGELAISDGWMILAPATSGDRTPGYEGS
jgi:acyl dehydratase